MTFGPESPNSPRFQAEASKAFKNIVGSSFGFSSSSATANPASSAANAGIGFATGDVLGVAMSIGQEIVAGIARKQAAKREAKAFQLSGQRLLEQSVLTETLAGFDELEFREQAGFELSTIESLFADAGVSPTGSALDVLLAAKRRFEIDALKIRESGRLKAKEERFESGQSFQQAEYARKAADKAFFGLF